MFCSACAGVLPPLYTAVDNAPAPSTTATVIVANLNDQRSITWAEGMGTIKAGDVTWVVTEHGAPGAHTITELTIAVTYLVTVGSVTYTASNWELVDAHDNHYTPSSFSPELADGVLGAGQTVSGSINFDVRSGAPGTVTLYLNEFYKPLISWQISVETSPTAASTTTP